MNSLFPCNNNEKNSKHCARTVPGEALLRCSNGSLVLNNITLPEGNLIQSFNQPIASVTIDTACLCNPKLLMDFAGVLTVTPLTNAAFSTFAFTLFRICEGSRVRETVATFNFNYIIFFLDIPDSRTLKFEYSPCDDQCKDCCTYILELTSISNQFLLTTNVSINGTLCALAVESSC